MKAVIDSGLAAARRTARPVAALLLASSLVLCSTGAMAAGSSHRSARTLAPISAKWVTRKLHFIYTPLGSPTTTTYYSCDGLRNSVTSILRLLGARKDLVVKSFGCIRFEGPERFPGVDATFSALEPAGTGDQGSAHAQNVAARWDKVTLNAETAQYFTNAYSRELIEQAKNRILPLFATRNPTESMGGKRLSVEVLRPIESTRPRRAPP
jgi:hypothetical protein